MDKSKKSIVQTKEGSPDSGNGSHPVFSNCTTVVALCEGSVD